MAQNVNSTAPNLLTVASNHATVPYQAQGLILPPLLSSIQILFKY